MKRSKSIKYDDPSAFHQHFPTIRKVDSFGTLDRVVTGALEQCFQMGKVKVTIVEPSADRAGYFMTIRCNNRYPTWDEIVWIRYNLIPDAVVMSMVLPNLNNYINIENTDMRYVFTFEQREWALQPQPYCPMCRLPVDSIEIDVDTAEAVCLNPVCSNGTFEIDLKTWNEQHGNGFHGRNHDT